MSPRARREDRVAANHLWYERHKEEMALRNRAYYETHKEQIVAQHRIYRERNKESITAKDARYRQKHRARRIAVKQAYYQMHKAETMARNREWRRRNSIKLLEQRRRARERRERLLEYAVCDFRADEWVVIKEMQGGRCAICREVRPLERDHIIPLSKGGHHTASNIQGLCRSCNAKKGNRMVKAEVLQLGPDGLEARMKGKLPRVLFERR